MLSGHILICQFLSTVVVYHFYLFMAIWGCNGSRGSVLHELCDTAEGHGPRNWQTSSSESLLISDRKLMRSNGRRSDWFIIKLLCLRGRDDLILCTGVRYWVKYYFTSKKNEHRQWSVESTMRLWVRGKRPLNQTDWFLISWIEGRRVWGNIS